MSNQEQKPDTQAYIQRWVEEAAESGELELRAKRLGVSYGDAMISLAEELERPFKEIRERYATRPAPAPDEEEIDRLARSYAEKHGTSYAIGLDSVIGTTPGAGRAVQLEEKAAAPVDADDEAINRRAQDRARREGCSYEVALEAVLEDA